MSHITGSKKKAKTRCKVTARPRDVGQEAQDHVEERDERHQHDQHGGDVGDEDDAVAGALGDGVHGADRRIENFEARLGRGIGPERDHERRDARAPPVC